MKKELKLAKAERCFGDSQIIVIHENGVVSIPNKVRMSISEIANLFDISYQTIKKNIRTIEKLANASGDYDMSCMVEGLTIYPDYYGLEMVTALAFRVQSTKAEQFRKWIIQQLLAPNMLNLGVLNKKQNYLLN